MEDVVIERSDRPMYYYVTFKKDTMKARYLACPVLTTEPYREACKKYESTFTAYQRELAKRKDQEEQMEQQMIRQRRSQRDAAAGDISSASMQARDYVIRSFVIMKFGIWNYDKPLKYNQMVSIKPTIKVNDTLYFMTFYLADQTRNALITFNPGNNLVYEKDSKNLLWMAIRKKQVAVFSAEDFAGIPAGSVNYTFNLRLIKTPLNSSEDFLKLYHNEFKETP